jgi:hypothetical protein
LCDGQLEQPFRPPSTSPMPDFRFHLPRFLRSHRSSRSHSSSANPSNDTAASNSPNPGHPSSTPQQAMDVITATSYKSPASSMTADGPGIDDCSGRSSQISEPVTLMNAVNLNPTPQLNAQGLVARPPTHSPHLPDSSDSTQSQRLPCSPAIPSQQSSVFERQMVSLLLIFNL